MTNTSIPADEVRFFSGSSNKALAASIANELGVPLDDTLITRFSNDNLYIQLADRGRIARDRRAAGPRQNHEARGSPGPLH